MRTIIVLIMLMMAMGCTSEQPTGSNMTGDSSMADQPSDSSQQVADANASLSECLEDICGTGNSSIERICQVSCWNDYALETENAAYCDKNFELINSSTGYNVCVEDLAKKINDPQPCSLIKNEFGRDLCYVELAKYLDDPSVCDNVGEEDKMLIKQDCLNALTD
jgi:hypothetical protein